MDEQEQLDKIESAILDLENAGATVNEKFVALLEEKIAICQRMQRFNEVNNCEARLRFIKAKIRGEKPPHAQIIDMDRARRRKRRNVSNTWLLGSVALFVVLLCLIPFIKNAVDTRKDPQHHQPPLSLFASAVTELNASKPGEEFDLTPFLKDGQTTVIYFHSDDCPPCEKLLPTYKKFAQRLRTIRFYTLDIDRAGTSGIDFESPLARQYEIQSIPYIVIYKGKAPTLTGGDAIDQLNAWYIESES